LDLGTILIFVMLAVVGAIGYVGNKAGVVVLWGGQEKSNRIIGRRVRVGPRWLEDDPPCGTFTATVTAFDASTHSYQLRLHRPHQVNDHTFDSVRIRSAEPGHPVSGIGLLRRRSLRIELDLPSIGWVPAGLDRIL
jgi:hypothetical protein